MPTVTIYADTNDGFIDGTSAGSYASARATSTGCEDTLSTASCGQLYSAPVYSVYRGPYLHFDTTSANIPTAATITGATIYVCAAGDSSTTDFDIVLYRMDWEAPLGDAGLRETNYDDALAATLVGTLRNTSSGWTTNTYYSMSLNTAQIDRDNGTRYVFLSAEDVANSAPTNNEFVQMYTAEEFGSSKAPYIEVTYTLPGVPNGLMMMGAGA